MRYGAVAAAVVSRSRPVKFRRPGEIVTEFMEEYSWLAADAAIVAFFSLLILAACWFVATNLRDVWRAAVWAIRSLAAGSAPGPARPSASGMAPAPLIAAEPRLSAAVQWARVTGVVAAAVLRAGALKNLQGAASDQVDAAHYALKRLSAELKGLIGAEEMAAPPKASLRPRRARRAHRDAPRGKLAA